jgi:signal transduction histidine kinase
VASNQKNMKLLTKTTLWYLSMTMVLFAIGGVLFYFSLRNIMDENITENLEQTQTKVLDYVKKTGKLPEASLIGRDILNFIPADKAIQDVLKDTTIYNPYEEENLPFRELLFSVKTNDGLFTATAGTPLVESDDLIESIVNSLGIVAGILLVVLFLLNWFLSKSMWKPFHKTLDSLKTFDLSKKEALTFPTENTSEFKMLNEALGKMTEKIMSDYQSLKEFTENASHELQTPLAIIRSKLELMVQAENLSEEQVKQVQDIYESVNRLSKLNQSLLLLAKIENCQFHETQILDASALVEKKLGQLEELIDLKGIKVEKKLGPGAEIKMNPQLADILLSNILSNAIRHNTSGGTITVEVKNNLLTVSNSGNLLEISNEKLFERFQKGTTSSESVGLGLSIVKQICDTYNFNVNYSYLSGTHTITITF